MLCSWENIKRDYYGKIFFSGMALLLLYICLTFLVKFITPPNIALITFKHVHFSFSVSLETASHIGTFALMIWHIFWISAVSGLLGFPIAKIFVDCLDKAAEAAYRKTGRKLKQSTTDSCKWSTILLTLKEKHCISEFNQLSMYVIDNDVFNLSNYTVVNTSVRYLKTLSDLLFKCENIADNKCKKQLSLYNSNIQLLHFKLQIYKQLKNVQYLVYPAVIALLLQSILKAVDYMSLPEGIMSLFLGIIIFLLSINLSFLSYFTIGLISYPWQKETNYFGSLIFKAYSIFISLAVLIILMLFSVYILTPVNSAEGLNNLKLLITTGTNILVPFIYTDSEYNLLRYLPINILYMIYVPVTISIAILLWNILKRFLSKYNKRTVGEGMRFTIPVELTRIYSIFFVITIATGLCIISIYQVQTSMSRSYYSSVSTQFNQNTKANSLNDATVTVFPDIKKSINESTNTIENFLPFTIFLALVGAFLAITTRDLIENYFAGLSMKMDMPFERGDRIKVKGVGVCEVRELGIRSARLYSISTNSIVIIPNNVLTKEIIINYTPTPLYSRKTLTISVASEFGKNNKATKKKHSFVFHECRDKNSTVVEVSRSLLVLSAFLTARVKCPSAKLFFCYNWALENRECAVESYEKSMRIKVINDIDKYIQNSNVTVNESNKFISLLESVASKSNYLDVDLVELEFIMSRLILIFKINEESLKDLLLSDTLLLLCKSNLFYLNTDLICRLKVRFAKVLYLLYTLEIKKSGLVNKSSVDRRHVSAKKEWEASNYIACLTEQYFTIDELLWGMKAQSNKQIISTRIIDQARLKLQDIPRVKCVQKHSSEGYVYWELTLYVTIGSDEEANEILFNINNHIDRCWKQTGLSKVMINK